jgi:circadian clock protein KaiC
MSECVVDFTILWPTARRREICRLQAWLLAHELSCIVTLKAAPDETHSNIQQRYGFMQFMIDCAVLLILSIVADASQRNLRVQKYRGSRVDENESPFVIGKTGFGVAIVYLLGRVDAALTNERVTSGVKRLDTMLGGGYYRAACVLITGFPGTAKTTLSGAFAEAACRRGEPIMFVSFDSDGTEVIRNLASVGIRLDRYGKSGLLRTASGRSITGSAETCLVRITALTLAHQARGVVIDPVSALSQSGNELTAHGVAERLLEWSKADRITCVCTSLLSEVAGQTEGDTSLYISALADTWIHLNYLMQAVERNRSTSIIKSRGTAAPRRK